MEDVEKVKKITHEQKGNTKSKMRIRNCDAEKCIFKTYFEQQKRELENLKADNGNYWV